MGGNGRKALGLAAAVGLLGLAAWAGASWLQERQQFEANLDTIVGLLAIPEHAKPREQFDAARRFVTDNSRHAVDAEFRKVQGDRNLIAGGVIAYAEDRRAEPIHLECSTRSNLLAAVLRKLGYRTRIVAIFDTDSDLLRSHSFVDVLNPTSGKWETQDPDFDLYWRSKASGERVSLAEAAEDVSDLEPCHGPNACGWDVESAEGKSASKLRALLDIVTTNDKERDLRSAHFTSRAELSKIFTVGDRRGRFCELMAKRCAGGLEPLSSGDPAPPRS
jgi:hypothetical protein